MDDNLPKQITIKDFHRLHPHASAQIEFLAPLDLPSKFSLVLECNYYNDKSLSQRSTLFRIQCKVDKAICSLIINSGSQENLVSTAMVELLHLTTENWHPSFG